MEVGNDIVIQNGTQWSFGNGVAQHFDEHVRQSIPLYYEGHDLVCHLSDFFIRDHSLCYELDSATGNLIGKLYQRHKSKKEVRFIGIEEIPEMNQVAQSKFPDLEFITSSVEEARLEPSDLIISYYFLRNQLTGTRKYLKRKL